MNKQNFFLHILHLKRLQVMVCLLIGIFSTTLLSAKSPHFKADKEVKGRILDEKGSPVSNVSVVVKGTTVGSTSGDDGAFVVHVPDGKSTLVISSIGYETQEIDVKNTNNLSITLFSATGKLNDVVVVGYGTQKKVTVTGAVTSVKGTELEKAPTVNLSNALVGRLSGVTAVQSSGEPGYDGSSIRIRGVNTFGNSSALIVVDGVPDIAGGLERINPADVESMSVLKDGSAAIYGSRAANGVILITTKHGKTGKPQVSYNFNQGWSQPTLIPKMASAVEYAQMNNSTTIYDGIPSGEWGAAEAAFNSTGSYKTQGGNTFLAPFQPGDVAKYKDGSDPWGHPNTDWFKTTLKNWSPQSQHTLQIKGGSENVRYLTSFGYENQDGYYKNSATGYKQYNMLTNIDAKINKYISTSVGLTAREEYRHFPTQSAGSIFRMLMRGRPTDPEVWPNGLPGPDIENGQNPIVIATNQTGYADDRSDFFQLNGKIEFLIPGVPGLKLSATANVDKEIERTKTWQTPWYLYFWDHSTVDANGIPVLTKNLRSTFTSPQLNENDYNTLNILTSGFINYDKTFGDHTINLLAAVTKETDKEDDFGAYRTNFISPALDQLFAGGTAGQQASGAGYNRARLSYFGRAAYNYKEKYLLEFLWRADGSYLFDTKQRWGFFPGFLGGWRISEEKWFKDNVKFVSNLKLRGSYAEVGNDQVYYGGSLKEYQYLSTYGFGSYTINDQGFKTLYETVVPNPSFTWETAKNADIGLEGALLNNHITFEVDWFLNKRSNILWRKQGSTPASSGIGNLLPPTNIGKSQNKGYDWTVGYNGHSGDFTFAVNVTGGVYKNKIVFQDEPPGAPAWQLATGHPYTSGGGGTYLAYEYDGVFATQKDIDANSIDYSGLTPALKPGDMKFKDINHDGKITADDQVRLDKSIDPTFTGGVNFNVGYKGFDLSILFQGATGGLLYINTESGDIGNYLQYTYDHQWTIDHPSSVDPRIANRSNTYYDGGNAGNNTYYLYNTNYLRLKNVELGYNLGGTLLKKSGISALRVYANALNLATWSKQKVYDPESTNGSGQYYPQARIINVGAKVTF